MPKRRYRRYRSKTPVRRRRYKKTYRRKRVARAFPDKVAVSLPYSEIDLSFSSEAGLAGSFFFRANSVFDPNETGTGHQPKGFDQYMLFYQHYVVIGSKIRVTFQNNADIPIRVGLMLRDEANFTALDPDTIGEYRHKRESGCDAVTAGGRSTTTVTLNCSPRKFLGRSKVLSDSQLKGGATTNPAEMVFYQIYAFALDGSSALASTSMRVHIDYSVVFFEPQFGIGS